MDDRRLSAVAAVNAGPHVLGNGDVVVHPATGRAVPRAQERGQDGQRHACREASLLADVVPGPIPHIAHGGEAVAHVPSSRTRPHAVGHAVARGQDQIVTREVEAAHRRRHEGQILPVPVGRGGQPLDERGDDVPVFDGRGHPARQVQQREEVRAGDRARRTPPGSALRLAFRSASRGRAPPSSRDYRVAREDPRDGGPWADDDSHATTPRDGAGGKSRNRSKSGGAPRRGRHATSVSGAWGAPAPMC